MGVGKLFDCWKQATGVRCDFGRHIGRYSDRAFQQALVNDSGASTCGDDSNAS